jgi:hypothetical protein
MHRWIVMEKPYDIQDRAFLFACTIVDFCRPLVIGHPVVRELGILTAIKKNAESDDGRG